MTATVTIGEFARLSHLSVKTLRYYHEVALLEPADVDPSTGYRRYATSQVAAAQLIRRLRELDMPLPDIRAVLTAADQDERDAALRAHLRRMEEQLDRTRAVVASLRTLLTEQAPLEVGYRTVPACRALTRVDRVARADISAWCGQTFPLLFRALAAAGVAATGAPGSTFSSEYFTDETGEVVAFVPIGPGARFDPPPGTSIRELPAGRFAIATHRGPYHDIDRVYGALGSHVAEHDSALDEPVREVYLTGPGEAVTAADYLTELCWPIDQH